MKRFLTLSTTLLIVLVGCGATNASAENETGNNDDGNSITIETPVANAFAVFGLTEPDKGLIIESAERKEAARLAIEAHNARIEKNRADIASITKKLNKYVGKTWYAFAGSTPRGWDCSGLVKWYYKNLGIDLYHSATAQKYEGKPRKYSEKKAKVGDIIWNPGHVGIYVGNGYMIHSPRPGKLTELVKVSKWAKDNGTTNVTYTRLLEN
jgi:cell wall-associated NlpC family hydrolase